MGARKYQQKQSIVAQAATVVQPTAYVDYSKFLDALYLHIKSSQPYSYQDFSNDLGFGSNTYMHQIIRRYRSLTQKNSEKIVLSLQLSGPEKKYFLLLVKYAHARDAQQREAAWRDILKIKAAETASSPDQDILEYFGQWYHPVLREFVTLASAPFDPASVAKELVPGIRPEQVKESIELLERLKLIEFDAETGKYRQTCERVSTGHRVKNHAITNFHLQMINLAKDSLANVSGKERDVSALTLKVSEKTFERLKGMIHAFQLQLLEEAEKDQRSDRIVQVNIQMFPVSKIKKLG